MLLKNVKWGDHDRIVQAGVVVLIPKGPGCGDCIVCKGCFPLWTWEVFAAKYQSDPTVRDACSTGLRRYQERGELYIKDDIAAGLRTTGFRIESPFLVFTEQQFVMKFKASPHDIKGVVVLDWPNEFGNRETLAFVRDTVAPRRAVLYSEAGNMLRESLFDQHLRVGQAADAYDAGARLFQAALERLGRPTVKIPDASEALALADAFNVDLARREAAAAADALTGASASSSVPAPAASDASGLAVPSWMASTAAASSARSSAAARRPAVATPKARLPPPAAVAPAPPAVPSRRRPAAGAPSSAAASVAPSAASSAIVNLMSASSAAAARESHAGSVRGADARSVATSDKRAENTAPGTASTSSSTYFSYTELMTGSQDVRCINGVSLPVTLRSFSSWRPLASNVCNGL
jgi:hypothetical protein